MFNRKHFCKMKIQKYRFASLALVAIAISLIGHGFCDDGPVFGKDYGTKKGSEIEKVAEENKQYMPATLQEAQGRARMLYEAIHGTLQVIHRDYFGDDEELDLPSQSLEDVFKELERTNHVRLHWLVVNGKVMDTDHEAENRFEEKVVEEFDKNGKYTLEAMQGDTYRFAGRIRLRNSCLKCHVPKRESLEERAAALVISIKLKGKDEKAKSGEPVPVASANK